MEKNNKDSHSLKTAIWLYWKCWEKDPQLIAEYEVIKIREENDSHLIDIIRSGFQGIEVAFVSRLKSWTSQLGPPRICLVRQNNGEVVVRWLGNKSFDSQLNVKKILTSHLEMYGELEEPMSDLIAKLFLQEMFESEISGITIPGFRRISAKEKSTMVVLELIPTNFEKCMLPTRMY